MSTASRLGKIVVGVDGSQYAATALSWALEEARLRHLPLEVLYVFPSLASHAGGTTPEYYPDAEKEAAEVLDRVLAGMPEHSGVEVRRALVPGNPAAQLVAASREANLLVVGSRGLGEFRGMLLGSVSIHCVQQAHCPVVVVREAGAV